MTTSSAVTTSSALFIRLADDLDHRLGSRRTRPSAATWAAREPALSGIVRAVDAVERCGDRRRPQEGRAALAGLLRLAGDDRLAADAAMAAVIPALRAVAGELTRAWRADSADIDQAVAAAGWDRIVGLAGHTVAWPDRVIAAGARDAVRGRLRTAARRGPTGSFPDGGGHHAPAAGGDGYEAVEVVDLLRRALDGHVVDLGAVRAMWEVRALRVPAVELAGRDGRQPAAVRRQYLRAESALRRHLRVDGAAVVADAG